MSAPTNPRPSHKGDTKSLLSAIKLTTTLGAVSLTLAGWGLLARAEAVDASQAAADAPVLMAAAGAMPSTATVTSTVAVATRTISSASMIAARQAALAPAATLPTPTSAPTPTAVPTTTAATAALAIAPATATPAPTVLPPVQFTLNVVQWTQTNAGDPVAVVQDESGALWYVWGPDVDRIERGLDPQYQPVPVNSTARTRRS